MAAIMPGMAGLAGGASAAGGLGSLFSFGNILTGLSSVSKILSGNSEAKSIKAAADAQAAQMERNAGQERASAQRTMVAERKKSDLLNSRATAVAAAGGGSATDPTVIDIMGDITEQGEYNAMTALYNGESRASGMEDQARSTRFEAGMKAKSTRQKGFLGAAETLYSKYG